MQVLSDKGANYCAWWLKLVGTGARAQLCGVSRRVAEQVPHKVGRRV
jgi:hypothetical protein